MRMENRIEEMETRVNSYAELSASSSSPFGRLEYAKEVEEELEKMRAKKTGLEKQTPAEMHKRIGALTAPYAIFDFFQRPFSL